MNQRYTITIHSKSGDNWTQIDHPENLSLPSNLINGHLRLAVLFVIKEWAEKYGFRPDKYTLSLNGEEIENALLCGRETPRKGIFWAENHPSDKMTWTRPEKPESLENPPSPS